MNENQKLRQIIKAQEEKILKLETRLKDTYSFFSAFDAEISSIEFVEKFQSPKIFSIYLNEFLESNPKMSKLRISKALNISNARLYEYLNGSRLLTHTILDNVANLFELSSTHVETLKFLITQDRNYKKVAKEMVTKRINNLSKKKSGPLKEGHISSWLHYAILALFELKEFKNNRNWIVSKLGITSEQFEAAVEDLKQVGYLSRSGEEIQISMLEDHYVSPSESKESVKEMTISQLEKLIETYKNLNLPYENNEKAAFTSYYVTTTKDKIEDAQKMLESSFAQVGQFLEDSTKEELYTLSFQLAPLTKKPVV